MRLHYVAIHGPKIPISAQAKVEIGASKFITAEGADVETSPVRTRRWRSNLLYFFA
jgi:hypothetical protein